MRFDEQWTTGEQLAFTAELAAGTMTEVTIPSTHRWIPKGMQVDYVSKADTDLVATAQLESMPEFTVAAELPVTVNVTDTSDSLVLRAVITMWVAPRK